ncbi:leucine-rich repeat-containing protein 40-like [Chelonus insularis]|uniref:leucine-rich repeat-containing protein 40-like n=1 Tax=Chelonus insularis TaxID=460826 RepID=UPI00158B8F42|nr:leucine-rich repeat-containing protein 40-like [Chelonus insularis]
MSAVRRKDRVNHLAVFKPRTKKDDNNELSERIIVEARRTGELTLSGRGLATVPKRVWTLHELTEGEIAELYREIDFDSNDKDHWWEYEPLKTLNLSSNSITNIDSEVENLLDLVELDIHDNLLENLPNQIRSLLKLKILNLSHNKLTEVNINLYTLENLRQLNLSYNSLQKLDPAIGDLVMLESLNLSHNNLKELPVGLGYLVRLCNLDLSHNLLVELPPDIMSMRVLKTLDASSNHLEVIPAFGELRKLETLNLQDNNLSVFPNMTGCTALRELLLSNNNIVEIDMECLEGIGQLKSLLLSHNKIETIPDEMIKLLNLERLDASFNKLTQISNSICVMPNLKYFIIEGNQVKNVRRDIIQCGTPRILRHLRQQLDGESIDLNQSSTVCSNSISMPDRYTMKNTKLLSLTNKNLDLIPENVIEDAILAEVTCVDLSRNKLSQLPDKLALIKFTEDLKLFCNRLTSIPNWIGEAYNRLRYLDLSKNLLSSLPDTIGMLEHLREINISHNKFVTVPDCIYNILHLEILVVHDNQIEEINAEALSKLKRLATLDLSNNNIKFVPPELGNQTNLRTLLLSGNCFRQPRHEMLMKSTEEILSYLRNRICDARVSAMESPVMYETGAHQVQNQGVGDLKKSQGLPGNNNNSPNNNNNSSLQVNHNQQTSSTVSKVSASKASLHQQYAEHCAAAGELTDLNNPEISLDLQHLIDDSHFNDGLLDMLSSGNGAVKHTRNTGYPRTTLAYMPQPVHSGASYHQNSNSCSDSNSSSSESPSIKEEPMDPTDYRRHCPQYPPGGYNPGNGPFTNGGPTFTTLTPSAVPGHPVHHQHPQQQQQSQHQQHQQPPRGPMKPVITHQHQAAAAAAAAAAAVARKQNKTIDKASDEYRRRRERNNIAVRKSREKAKVRSRETEEKVKLLVKDNDILKKRIELLTEELTVFRTLFNNVGVVPEHMHRELARHLEPFQQHTPM